MNMRNSNNTHSKTHFLTLTLLLTEIHESHHIENGLHIKSWDPPDFTHKKMIVEKHVRMSVVRTTRREEEC